VDKYIKAVLAGLFLMAPHVSLAEIRVTERDYEKIYQSQLANETWLSEVKINSTVFKEYVVATCLESGVLMLRDDEVMLKWPDNGYDKLAYAITRVSADAVSIEIAINKSKADGADIPSTVIGIFSNNPCRYPANIDPIPLNRKLFKVEKIEGLTDVGDILDRAEHLSKIYAR